MLGRILVHLPWMSALSLFVAVIAIEVFIARPGEEEGARQAAVGALRGRFARDVSLIESALRVKSMEQVQIITSETTGLAGLEVILLADPEGRLVACSAGGLVPGQVLPQEPPYDLLRPRAGTDFAPEIIRQPGANIFDSVASVDFSVGDTPGQGLLYERWNLEPLVSPMIASSRSGK